MAVSVTWNSGPSIEQRREFAGLKDGTQVPGYLGYIPQLRYQAGSTYGRHTEELSHQEPFRKSQTFIRPSNEESCSQNLLPRTGQGKYTRNMIPGYTGYIPQGNFFYGKNYKESCDSCISEHIHEFDKYKRMQSDLKNKVSSNFKLEAINKNPCVRSQLESYKNSYGVKASITAKREATEPPIPGYQGFIPRTYTTGLGVGSKYHEMTSEALLLFEEEQRHQRNIQNGLDEGRKLTSAPPIGSRLYNQAGMIPKYTGYIPQKRYVQGQTYGATTRSLAVCAHELPCYGDFMKEHEQLSY